MRADLKARFRMAAKFCSVAAIILLVILALGPEDWTPRTPLGWQFDHFIGYFVITLLVCFAWQRPFIVAPLLAAASFLLEGLQAFTPDRTANFVAGLCGAVGVLVAAVISKFFVRAKRNLGTL